MQNLFNWFAYNHILPIRSRRLSGHYKQQTRKVVPTNFIDVRGMRSLELGWCECVLQLNERAVARLEIDECERYLSYIHKALHGSPEQIRVNKDMNILLSTCGWKFTIVKDWVDVVEMEYAARTIKYVYFILCLCGKDMNVALEYLLLHPIDESVLELSPEIWVDGAT